MARGLPPFPFIFLQQILNITAHNLDAPSRIHPVISTDPAIPYIVGYQTKTSGEGQNFLAPTFRNVTGGNISVQDIKLSGANVMEYIDSCYVLDASGVPKEGMTFFWTADGWIDDQYAIATAELTPGEGIVVNTMMAGVDIQFSGEVGTKDLQLISNEGQNFIGNASPVEIDVQSMTLSGANVMEYIDSCYVLDASGVPQDGMTFFWTADGWIDDQYAPTTAKFASGEGVVVNTMQAGVEINLPGVTL